MRNALFGATIVFGGLGLAILTLWAQWTNNPRLAGAAAIASLIFVVLILLFVVPPLARSASREVSSIDLPLEITAGGLVFLGIVAIVGFAAWNTGNNLLFLVLSFLVATLAVSFVVGNSNLKKLEARVRFPEAIFANQPTAFAISLNSRKWIFPTVSVTLALRGAMTDDPFGGRKFRVRPPRVMAKFLRAPYLRRTVGYFVYVGRRRAAEQQTEQMFSKRGRFIIKDFELSTKFPFGFWQQRKRLKVRETEVFVFPQPAEVGEIINQLAGQIGQFTATRRGAAQDLIGLREYQTSDDMRRVDWNATARTGNLIVRDYAADDERRVTIRFDRRIFAADQDEQIERFERGVNLTAGILTRLVNQKADVRLQIDDENNGEFGRDKAHLYESLRRLALLEPEFTAEPSSQNSAPDNSTILVTANDGEPNSTQFAQIVSY